MNNSDDIVLLGGGGHAKVLIDLIRLSGKYIIAGILDPDLDTGTEVSGVHVIGGDGLLTGLQQKGTNNVCIGVGYINSDGIRRKIFEQIKKEGFSVPFLIHPGAIVSAESEISEGVQIMAGVVVQAGCFIGENTIINTGAIIDHDCVIGANAHICPGVTISGGVDIGDNSFVGAGSTIKHGIRIGKGITVGAGSLVLNDLPDGVTVKGVPAK